MEAKGRVADAIDKCLDGPGTQPVRYSDLRAIAAELREGAGEKPPRRETTCCRCGRVFTDRQCTATEIATGKTWCDPMCPPSAMPTPEPIEVGQVWESSSGEVVWITTVGDKIVYEFVQDPDRDARMEDREFFLDPENFYRIPYRREES